MSSWWSTAVEIQRNVGKPYLYYNLRHAKTRINMNAKTMDNILRSQQNLFYSRFNKFNNAVLKNSEIDELLNDWTVGGMVGQKIAGQMNEIAALIDSGSYGTSGGLAIGDGEVRLSGAKSAFNTSKKKAIESCTSICKAVDRYMSNTIEVLAKNNENILAQAILDSYKTNTPLKVSVGDSRISESMLTESETKVTALINTINQNLNGLRSLGNSSYSANDVKSLYGSYIEALKSAFNSLGGTIHEIVVAHGINVAAGVGDGAIKKSEEESRRIVESSNGAFYSQWVAQDTDASGRETKNDVNIYYNKNGITFTVGGSIKLRQGQAFRGSGRGSRILGVEGLVAKSESYDSITKKLEQYIPGINQYGYQMMGAWNNNEGISNVRSDWWLMKQFAGAITFVDSIAGSGQAGDFSSLFIVNNRVFSVADILQKILDNSGSLTSGGGKYPFEVEELNYTSIQKKIKDNSKNKNVKIEAENRNRNTYSILAQEKIRITLNLGNLYGSNIFK